MASEKQALSQLEKAKKNSAEWENKAKLALKSGNQELAKKALASKVEVDNNIASSPKLPNPHPPDSKYLLMFYKF